MMRCRCVFLLVLAACPPPGAGAGAQPPGGAVAAGAGCPTADNVYVASYLASDDPAAPASHTGWVLPLFDQKVDSLGGQPEYVALDAEAAAAKGVPAAPPSVWLMTPG